MEIEQNLEKLSQQMEELNNSLNNKERIKNDYDKVIANTETAYFKLLEGSQTLLAILKRDEASLFKKLNEI